MKKSSFTLVELLVVISIIAILAAMVLGGVMIVQKKADETATRAGLASLKTAIKNYEMEYGVLPLPANVKKGDYYILSNREYDELIQLLSQANLSADCETGTDAANYLKNIPKNDRRNLKNRKFLDATPNFSMENYVDAWGERYIIVLDSDYSDTITLNNRDYNDSVLIYSVGPNGADDNGQAYGTNSNNKDHDDVLGW